MSFKKEASFDNSLESTLINNSKIFLHIQKTNIYESFKTYEANNEKDFFDILDYSW